MWIDEIKCPDKVTQLKQMGALPLTQLPVPSGRLGFMSCAGDLPLIQKQGKALSLERADKSSDAWYQLSHLQDF